MYTQTQDTTIGGHDVRVTVEGTQLAEDAWTYTTRVYVDDVQVDAAYNAASLHRVERERNAMLGALRRTYESA